MLLGLLCRLAAAATGQQSVEVVGPGGAAGFDVEQWNAAVRAGQPSLQLAIDVRTLLPWQEQKAEPSARQLALALLGVGGAGSTLRAGPHRLKVKALFEALRQRDFASLPHGERMLAVHASYEVAVAANHGLAFGAADDQMAALVDQFAAAGPLSLPAMDLLLLHLLALPHGDRHGRTAELVAKLRPIAHAATCSERKGTSRRIDAALLLVRRLRGETVPDDLLLAVCWPSDPLLDPQHTWIGVLAAGELPAAARAPLQPQLDRLLAARRADTAPQAGSWDPAAGADRSETTAWHLQSLQRASAWKRVAAAPAAEVVERR